jgi:hypothetical protein
VITAHGYGAIGAPSDSRANTWTLATNTSANNGGGFIAIYYAQNPSVGTNHTFTVGSGASPLIFVSAYSGARTAGVFDAGINGAVVNATTGQPGSITPAGGNELFVTAYTNVNGQATVTVSSPFSPATNDNGFNPNAGWSYVVADESGTAQNPTWTWNANARGPIVTATFRP